MNDEDYMRLALKLASAVAGQTSPNPPVGAVVVKDGEILGFGAHLKAGEEHAEVHALKMAGAKAKGATIYVTLEPCSHYGKTAPCADYIIEMEVQRVVIAVVDPNELIAGGGIEKLRKVGIHVDTGVLQEEAEDINKVFFHYIKMKMPYVTLKSAISLDGKTATVNGDSKWITGEKARLDVHRYRQKHDAILVGVNTVITDDPSLTTRLPLGGKNPIRVILDTALRTPIDANVVTDNEVDTWIFIGKNVTEREKAPFMKKDGVFLIQLEEEQIHVEKVLEVLGSKNIMSLFVEGGSAVNGSFLESKRINQVILYIAPMLIGGKDSPASFAGIGFQSIAETLSLEIKHVEMIGKDIKVIALPRKET